MRCRFPWFEFYYDFAGKAALAAKIRKSLCFWA